MLMTTIENGYVFKIDECLGVYFKNGCITGGGNSNNGGGVLIYGSTVVYMENMVLCNSDACGDIGLINVVTIQNNKGADYRCNLTLKGYDKNADCVYINKAVLSDGSCINVSMTVRDKDGKAIVKYIGYDTDNNKYFHADDTECELYTDLLGGASGFEQANPYYDGLFYRKKGGC